MMYTRQRGIKSKTILEAKINILNITLAVFTYPLIVLALGALVNTEYLIYALILAILWIVTTVVALSNIKKK